MFNNPYYNTQASLDKIDNQIRELENMRTHLQRPQPSINQTFQLAPNTQNEIKFVDSVENVMKEFHITLKQLGNLQKNTQKVFIW